MHPASAALANTRVWRADRLPSTDFGTVSSGHPLLDAQLPGAGWPLGALVELRLTHSVASWSPLLLPALASQLQQRRGLLAWVQPPCEPGMAALVAAGVPPQKSIWLRGRQSADAAWLAEQALSCVDVAAVLAWLPGLSTPVMQRLQRAAVRAQDVLFFVLHDSRHAASGAGASLRLEVGPLRVRRQALLQVRILRRRGPSLPQPLKLPVRVAWCPGPLPAPGAGSGAERHGLRLLHGNRAPATAEPASHALDRPALVG